RKLLKERVYRIPPPSELRKKQIPVIESIPFWVPSYVIDVVDIEVQPSLTNLAPRCSTPKQRRRKNLREIEKPQLKFSVKYNAKRRKLTVDLLESKNVGQGNLVHDTSLMESEKSFL
ncbi:hypothetical protein QZH41_015239, partial [Actinostola sp. cb2023]